MIGWAGAQDLNRGFKLIRQFPCPYVTSWLPGKLRYRFTTLHENPHLFEVHKRKKFLEDPVIIIIRICYLYNRHVVQNTANGILFVFLTKIIFNRSVLFNVMKVVSVCSGRFAAYPITEQLTNCQLIDNQNNLLSYLTESCLFTSRSHV